MRNATTAPRWPTSFVDVDRGDRRGRSHVSRDDASCRTELQRAVLLLWLVSPIVAWWIIATRGCQSCPTQQTFLRGLARQTWRYFEVLVNAEENWLPPDGTNPDTRGRLAPANQYQHGLARQSCGG
jgi:hypothetical protein